MKPSVTLVHATRTPRFAIGLACAIAGALCGVGAPANDLLVKVRDGSGAEVDDAVVSLYADAAGGPRPQPQIRVVDQVDKQFLPRVAAIHVGDLLSFPNSDNIRHHVYSFSPAKPFELPLYHGVPTDPVVFENAGKVVLGCNIHEQMSAHIYVLDTPWFGQTVKGAYTFRELKPGNYQLVVQHPRQDDTQDRERHAVVIDERPRQTVALTASFNPAVAADDSGLSPLERKFKALRRGQD